jgi:predicted HD superfamily hydrolase involved in NAD metabolism
MNSELPVYKYLQKKLTAKRFIHSVSTAACARALAIHFGANQDKAFLSGLVHDIAREMADQELIRIGKKIFNDSEGFYFSSPILLHSFAGAELLESEFGINDESILNAVKWHCCGHPLMDENAKIVYIADYIEPTRTHISANESLKVFEMNLDEALFYILCKEEEYYHSREIEICPDWKDLYKKLAKNRRHKE